jgi:cell division protein FtsI (penicillin-binding protein 3)
LEHGVNAHQGNRIRVRLLIIFALFALSLTVVAARAYQLQVLKRTELLRLAERQRKHITELSPFRGVIFDRKHHELAVSVAVDSVYARPRQMSDLRGTAQSLAASLGADPKKLLKKLQRGSPFVWVARGISPLQGNHLKELSLPGVHFIKENRRYYPDRAVGGHLLGFVGIDGDGLEGVEKRYDNYLNGGAAYLLVERDAFGEDIFPSDVLPMEPRHDNDLVLTIDANIQQILERELEKAVDSAHARGGTAIVMDPKTGEILGLAVQPGFNPNDFKTYGPDHWRNRAVADAFDPGSTFKVFLAAAAMEEGLASPEETIYCENGSYAVGGRTIHDVHKYGDLSFAEVIKYSSNIGAAKICSRLDAAVWHRYIRGFGFGEVTGIDVPGESGGLLRPYQKWRTIDKTTIAFGQGIAVTAVQLITALCAVANGGYVMQPYLVSEVVNRKGDCIKSNHPKVVRRAISEETAEQLTEMMVKVVDEDGGTGKNARVPGFEVAGKTGTAQKVDPVTGLFSRSKMVGSFMGFVPAHEPRLAILVVIDEPSGRGFGGTVAAPVFKAVAEQSLPYLGVFAPPPAPGIMTASVTVPPDREPKRAKATSPPLQPQPCAECVPDFTGLSMRRVLQMAKEHEFMVHVEGSGKAVTQKPLPGTPLRDTSECWVTFRPVS